MAALRWLVIAALVVGIGLMAVDIVPLAHSEGGRAKVLTLENLQGAEVAVGDKLAASLEAGSEAKLWMMAAGTVACRKSKLEGKVTSNPESQVDGSGVAVVEIESMTFGECTFTVAGAMGTVESVTTDTPWLASTNDTTQQFKITGKPAGQIEIDMKVKTAGGEKRECAGLARVTADYENGGAELIVAQFAQAYRGTSCDLPEWSAKYAPLKDESAGGKPVSMN